MNAGSRVLVVDDDPEIRLLLSRYLRRQGYAVEEAEDGARALEVLGKALPDVVVTDMVMPRLDGLGLLTALRDRDPDLPIIVLTGRGSWDNTIEALRSGMLFDYLLKPLADLVLLDAAILRALEVRRLRARAREADQVMAMRELAVTASDRILNPLNAVMLGLEILRRDQVAPEAKARAVAIIEEAIETITAVVRQMRSVARYARRQITRDLGGIDLERATAPPDGPDA